MNAILAAGFRRSSVSPVVPSGDVAALIEETKVVIADLHRPEPTMAATRGLEMLPRLVAALCAAAPVESAEADLEWGVEYGFEPLRAVEPMRDEESAHRFIANPALWATPSHHVDPVIVRRVKAGPWTPAETGENP